MLWSVVGWNNIHTLLSASVNAFCDRIGEAQKKKPRLISCFTMVLGDGRKIKDVAIILVIVDLPIRGKNKIHQENKNKNKIELVIAQTTLWTVFFSDGKILR